MTEIKEWMLPLGVLSWVWEWIEVTLMETGEKRRKDWNEREI